MGMEHFVSELEATAISGVSAKTLERFAETGYLTIERESDGLKLYSTEELKKVFGVADVPTPWDAPSSPEPSSPKKVIPKTANSKIEKPVQAAEPTSIVAIDPDEREETLIIEGHSAVSEDPLEEALEIFAEELDSEIEEEELVVEEPLIIEPATPFISPESITYDTSAPLLKDEIRSLEQDVARLEKINEVNEKVIELREEQLRELKTERNWLRHQVEKLEEKGDRDQVLLLSETQLLRQILEQQHSRRSPVRVALEWLGVVDQKPLQTTGNSMVLEHSSSRKK